MITTSGITGTCTVCLTDIESSETVYVHDKALHPLHPDCYDRWKNTCRDKVSAFTCPSCNKVLAVATPVLGLIDSADHLALNVNIEPPIQPSGIWRNIRQYNSFLTERILPEDNTPGREPINLMRNYLYAKVGVPERRLEVITVVDLCGYNSWPYWFAIQLGAATGDVRLLSSLYLTRTTKALAFEAFAATGKLELARGVLPLVFLNPNERGEGLGYFARTGLREGARLLFEQGPIPLTYRAKAIKTALSHRHYSIALDILFRSRSRINTIIPF